MFILSIQQPKPIISDLVEYLLARRRHNMRQLRQTQTIATQTLREKLEHDLMGGVCVVKTFLLYKLDNKRLLDYVLFVTAPLGC